MKNRVLLEDYYLPGDLERQVEAFVGYYNNERYHESLNNVTPADVYFARDKAILREGEKIRNLTIQTHRLQHQKTGGTINHTNEPEPPMLKPL